MSENIKKLYGAAKGDEALRAKLKEAENVGDVIIIAKAAGFEITIEELEAISKSRSGELSDDELVNVAGGDYGNGPQPGGSIYCPKCGVRNIGKPGGGFYECLWCL